MWRVSPAGLPPCPPSSLPPPPEPCPHTLTPPSPLDLHHNPHHPSQFRVSVRGGGRKGHGWSLIWECLSLSQRTPVLCVQQLVKGLYLPVKGACALVEHLSTFCSLFSIYLSTLHDAEFYRETKGGSACTGLCTLAVEISLDGEEVTHCLCV